MNRFWRCLFFSRSQPGTRRRDGKGPSHINELRHTLTQPALRDSFVSLADSWAATERRGRGSGGRRLE